MKKKKNRTKLNILGQGCMRGVSAAFGILRSGSFGKLYGSAGNCVPAQGSDRNDHTKRRAEEASFADRYHDFCTGSIFRSAEVSGAADILAQV